MKMNLFNKKASANMWWIIIGAVIALVVMIILMVMFTDKSGKLETGLSSCEGKGGECKPKKPGCPEGTLPATLFDCPPDKPNTICCLGNKK